MILQPGVSLLNLKEKESETITENNRTLAKMKENQENKLKQMDSELQRMEKLISW